MSRRTVLVQWIGHSDLRAMAASLPPKKQQAVLDSIKGSLPEEGDNGPTKTLLSWKTFDSVYLLSNYRDEILNASSMTCLTYYNHVAGYSPVDLVDGVATATRFLLPGDKATPEEHLVQSSDLEQDVKKKLLDPSACSDLNTLIATNSDLIKWCHDNGLPQVVNATPGSVRPITFAWSVA